MTNRFATRGIQYRTSGDFEVLQFSVSTKSLEILSLRAQKEGKSICRYVSDLIEHSAQSPENTKTGETQ